MTDNENRLLFLEDGVSHKAFRFITCKYPFLPKKLNWAFFRNILLS